MTRNLANTHDERYEIAFRMTMCNYMKKRKIIEYTKEIYIYTYIYNTF